MTPVVESSDARSGVLDVQPSPRDENNATGELRWHLCVLTLILLALCGVGRKMQYWPIMTWPVYGTRTTGFPESKVSYVELRVVTHTGNRIKVSPPEVLPMGRKQTLENAISYAFSDDESASRITNRKWLSAVLQDHLPQHELEAVEAWNILWDVDPLAIPPLDREHPCEQVLLGRFLLTTLEDAEAIEP